MDGKVHLQDADRKTLLKYYRKHPDPAIRLRSHIILLLATGYPWMVIASMLFCSTRTISRWKQRFLRDGLAGLTDERRGRPALFAAFWVEHVRRWILDCTPRDFGFLRSRWCCRVVVILLLEIHDVQVSEETVRRWLHGANLVWRRPRPVLGPVDPQREAKIAAIRRLLTDLPPDEIAVFQDEVDINLNPKIGSMWMIRGQQAQVQTPGNNDKCYLAGSLNWWTGALIVSEGPRRNTALFLRHLDDLRWHLRCYRKIHVICDNAPFHTSRAVHGYLAEHGERIVLHFLPKYAPECNPIERVWWKLHEEITRNHRCQTLDELLNLTFDWLEGRQPMQVEDETYFAKAA